MFHFCQVTESSGHNLKATSCNVQNTTKQTDSHFKDISKPAELYSVSEWHNVALTYTEERLSRWEEAWNFFSLLQLPSFSFTIWMDLLPQLYAMNHLDYFQAPFLMTVLCFVINLDCKLLCPGMWHEEASKQMRSGQAPEPCIARGRWGRIAVLQEPWLPFRIPKENRQTWLLCLSLCPLPVLFYRIEYILKQHRMRKLQSEADAPDFGVLNSASTYTLKQSSLTGDVFQNI